MTEPTPAPTQVQHPWRAVLRTIVAGIVALAPVAPELVDKLGVASVPWIISALAVLATITRVLALPAVHDWLDMYAPWLNPAPRPPQ